ncbi:uncharacterized protein B4U79_03386, partial [Dinothrombium tinctorium]
WPTSLSQESFLLLDTVVSAQSTVQIQRFFEKPRFGIITTTGNKIGFVFIEISATASNLREKVTSEFKHVIKDQHYILIDKIGWPVAPHQEDKLLVFDLARRGVIKIKLFEADEINNKDESDGGFLRSAISSESEDEMETERTLEKTEETESPQKIRRVSYDTEVTKALSDITSERNEVSHQAIYSIPSSVSTYSVSSSTNHKPILISYVRQEAERHARQLKTHLSDLGYEVFLDVDEIMGGHDWIDALNTAVVNCEVFVPLITPQYGLTIWTNREIKLADIKNKLIIPVNFLDHWPPECLAIQFATTQFLNWKSREEIEEAYRTQGERANDIKYWDEPFVHRAAQEIINISKKVANSNGLGLSFDRSTFASTFVSSPHSQIRNTFLQEDFVDKTDNISREFTDNIDQESGTMEDLFETEKPIFKSSMALLQSVSITKKQSLIVISAHPKERSFVEALRNKLHEYDYEVWSSLDMCIGMSFDHLNGNGEDIGSLTPTTPVFHSMPAFSSREESGIGNLASLMESEEIEAEDTFIPPQTRRPRPRFLNTLIEDSTNNRRFSQSSASDFSQNSLFTPEDLDKAKVFRQRVARARVVITILSSAYCKSKTCKSQAFYCDYRKTVVAALYEDCKIPHCLAKLVDQDLIRRDIPALMDPSNQNFLESIASKVNSIVNASKESFKEKMTDAKIQSFGHYLTKNIPIRDKKKIVVFVTGGSKFYNTGSEAICSSIAQTLAAKENVVLVTSGFYGAAEAVGRSFAEQRTALNKSLNLFHILPKKEGSNLKLKCRQGQDKAFEKLPFGETLFVGDSLHERDAVIARIFNYCILIEGGPYSARLAKEFIWNDNTVIPIMCTGGAASGLYDCSAKITEMPACVDQSDWDMLKEKCATSEDIASAVLRIIQSLVKWRNKNNSDRKYRFKNRRRYYGKNKNRNESTHEPKPGVVKV